MLLLQTFGLFETDSDFGLIKSWPLHYENDDDAANDDGDDDASAGGKDDDADDDAADKDKNGKFMSQIQIDKIVEDRLKKERAKNRKTLTRMQQLEQSAKLTEDERDQLRVEIEDLEKRTMTSEEIRKREAKKAEKLYEEQLTAAKSEAETWKTRHEQLKIGYEINTAAQVNGVLPESLPMITAFLQPLTTLVEATDEDGEKTGQFVTRVDFNDRDADGKPMAVQMSVAEVVERMRELPDLYGNQFGKDKSGGLGGTSGKAPGARKDGFKPGMSAADYMKLRKENPDALFGEG